MKKTALYDVMIDLGGKMVEFAGFSMPIQFEGIVKEHLAVRKSVGMFDVSHMGEIIIKGKDAEKFVDFLVTNKVTKLSDNQILYTPMCNENGGCVDDLLVYRFNNEHYLLVVNASNIDKDFNHIKKLSVNYNVNVENLSDSYAQIAIQGPKAAYVVQKIIDFNINDLKFYWFKNVKIDEIDVVLSRTGYTGEDGFELYCSSKHAERIWSLLMENGKEYDIKPCGLGARDTLRFENRLLLYGHELDDDTTPIEARLNWAIDWDSNFLGKKSILEEKQNGLKKKLVGLEIIKGGVPRQGYKIFSGDIEVGVVTSGCKAPYLNKFLALAYVKPEFSKIDTQLDVEIRDKRVLAKVVKTPFYKKPPLTVV